MNQFRGYVEIDINGQLTGFRFGTNSSALFCELNNCSLVEMGELFLKTNPGTIRDIFYSGYLANCRSKGIDVVWKTKWEFGDLLDELDNSVRDKLMETISVSNLLGVSIEIEEKKKTGKKS